MDATEGYIAYTGLHSRAVRYVEASNRVFAPASYGLSLALVASVVLDILPGLLAWPLYAHQLLLTVAATFVLFNSVSEHGRFPDLPVRQSRSPVLLICSAATLVGAVHLLARVFAGG